jgi:hypothetical protein
MDFNKYLNMSRGAASEAVKAKLLEIKELLAKENDQTNEMIDTYQRYVQGTVSDDEMDKANEQFKNLLKTVGLGVLVVLPFSPITIPAILKLAKKHGIDVLPDAFKKEK